MRRIISALVFAIFAVGLAALSASSRSDVFEQFECVPGAEGCPLNNVCFNGTGRDGRGQIVYGTCVNFAGNPDIFIMFKNTSYIQKGCSVYNTFRQCVTSSSVKCNTRFFWAWDCDDPLSQVCYQTLYGQTCQTYSYP